MRRSLFDEFRPPPAKPRLKPNIFALLAQFGALHSGWVIATFALIFAGLLWPIAANHSSRGKVELSANGRVGVGWQRLAQDFPGIENLETLSVKNADAEQQAKIQTDLLAKFSSRADLFQTVLAPGSGTYYENYEIYYHSPAEIDARVSYALSLKPLFEAVAAAPNAASLTTLVNEVSASIEQGRDPQGLDMLLTESAASLKELLSGRERSVDWLKVAGLETGDAPQSNMMLLWPRPEALQAAYNFTDAAMKGLDKDGKTKVDIQRPALKIQPQELHDFANLPAVMAISFILVVMVLYALTGLFRLVLIIAAPSIFSGLAACAAAAIIAPANWLGFWPVAGASCLLGLLFGFRFTFACLEPLEKNRSVITALMLAAQKQGQSLVLLAIAFAILWGSWLVLYDHNSIVILAIALGGAIMALASTLILAPAIFDLGSEPWQWQAADWLEPLYDTVFADRASPQVLLILKSSVFPILALTLWFFPPALGVSANAPSSHAPVNLIAANVRAAEQAIVALKAIPQAGSVRWLGAFLPDDVEAKQLVLSQMKGVFPHIDPQQHLSLDDLHDQIDMLREALTSIAAAKNARPELTAAADDFRRSLELFVSTGTDEELLKLENRLFGSFNRLADGADQWASLPAPQASALDSNLKALFQAKNGDLRVEVSPSAGTSQQALAQVLQAAGFSVADSNLDQLSAHDNFLRAAKFLAAASVLLGFVSSLVATQILSQAINAALAGLATIGLGGELASLLGIPAEPITLLILTAGLSVGFSVSLAKNIAPRQRDWVQQIVQDWAPVLVMSGALAPFAILGEINLFRQFELFISVSLMATIFAVLFQASTPRHGADLPEW